MYCTVHIYSKFGSNHIPLRKNFWIFRICFFDKCYVVYAYFKIKIIKNFYNNDLDNNTPSIRYNQSAEVIQIYKDESWIDWLTENHSGIIVVSSPQYILKSSDSNIGKDITGGWNVAGNFEVIDNESKQSETSNMISLNNITHIDFSYGYYSISNSGTPTSYAGFKAYLIDEYGNQVNVKSTNSGKGMGNFSISIDTKSLTGMYKIGYKMNAYYYKIKHDSWNEYQGARTYISSIALFTI